MKKNKLLFLLFQLIFFSAFSREGLWVPQLLKELNETEMRSMGMQLSAEDLYSINHSSLKDAILQFGSGCTGEVVSAKGLFITNYHCGFFQIQSLSSIENNYIENGFWAMSSDNELPVPGLTVTFIREIRDVSEEMNATLSLVVNEDQRNTLIKSISDSLEKKYSVTGLKANIKSFYAGNKFYLFLTETFRDIRLAGAPPRSIGKFGGEKDNWIWPRHNADFGIFRIYAGKNNKPADYSKENLPYTTTTFLPINISGVKEGDFVFSFGFPGKTNEYATASALDLVVNQSNPNKIRIRDLRLSAWKEEMMKSDTVYLKYTAKYNTLENYFKKWKGELLGFNKFDIISKKRLMEESFSSEKSRNLIQQYDDTNRVFRKWSYLSDYYTEALNAIELVSYAGKYKELINLCANPKTEKQLIHAEGLKLEKSISGFYRNLDVDLDKKMCTVMMTLADSALPTEFKPEQLKVGEKSFASFADNLYSSTVFKSQKELLHLLENLTKAAAKIKKDKAYQFAIGIHNQQKKIDANVNRLNKELARIQRLYIAELMVLKPKLVSYPDANSTLRLSYGKVLRMMPRDGLEYKFYTTATGLLEKNSTGEQEYKLPESFISLLKAKDFGRYSKNGELNVAFISSIHTTNGNSGSPVLNAKGELVGVNFDRVWEGVVSDYYYDETLSRNVSLDIRYLLFVVEKYGKAKSLLDEMTIIEN